MITKEDTTIIDGAGNAEEIKSRVDQTVLNRSNYFWLRPWNLQERVAKLAGGSCN